MVLESLFKLLSTTDLILFDGILLLIMLFLMFKWFFLQVRDIAKDAGGFIKFGQITFILLSWGVFIVILIYYMVHPGEVDNINILLTIIVGFLGTIIGLFFSERSLEDLRRGISTKNKSIKELLEYVEEFPAALEELKKLRRGN